MLLKEFETELLEQHKNNKTTNGYVKDINGFLEFLQMKQLYINDIREVTIKEYLSKLRKEGFAPSTQSRKISALRKYFKFLRKNRIMNHNPIEDITNPIIIKKENRVEEEEFLDLLERIKQLEKKREMFLREKIFLHLMYYNKIPLSEIVQIEKEKYKEDQKVLYLNKAIKIYDETAMLLKRYLELNEHKENYIFMNQKGEPLTESGGYFLLKKLFKAINKKTVTPRDLFKKNEK